MRFQEHNKSGGKGLRFFLHGGIRNRCPFPAALQSKLRAGLTLSVGLQLMRYEQYEYDYVNKTYKKKGLSGIKADKFSYFNGMFQVGYMYRFAR